ncbi:hypothetical protein VE03_00174 [Pseudogymnoascus sp. 23342-1-I1]|nr:hypothetical protein VE03_00174 [Pseudogymnoascus sp. 23342-1-I1]
MSTLPTPPSHATPTPSSPTSPVRQQQQASPPRIIIKSPTCSPPSPSSSSSSGSSTETEMSDRREKREGGSGGKSGGSSKAGGSKSSSSSGGAKTGGGKKAQKDDWSGVNEPDERRRIQNRLAQRKFREKAKDQKESRDRDAENQLHAGYSYTSPDPDDLGPESELSGLPWGGPSMRHIVERGRGAQGGSRQGSRDYSFCEYGGTGRGSGNSRGSDSR